jgi:hypothetical protein
LKKRSKKTFLLLDPSGGDAGASASMPANGQKFFWFFFSKKELLAFLPLAFLFSGSQANGVNQKDFCPFAVARCGRLRSAGETQKWQ